MSDEQERDSASMYARLLDLFRYVTADNAGEYIAIMRLFNETLLTDLSASEVTGQLGERGLVVDVDSVEDRCRQLERWGNLVRTVRDRRVATVADHLRAPQISGLEARRPSTAAWSKLSIAS